MTDKEKKQIRQQNWQKSVHLTPEMFRRLVDEKLHRANFAVKEMKRLEGKNQAR